MGGQTMGTELLNALVNAEEEAERVCIVASEV
jgi:hypothetical protein